MDTEKVESISEDALSSLPDDILSQILSLLSIKRAASTCILSKRWRNLFPFMIASQHHLEFDDSDVLNPNEVDVQDSFRAFVDSTLSLQQGGNCNPIKKLSLNCQDDVVHFKTHTKRWISDSLKRGVSELDLRFTMPLITKYRKCFLPDIIFTSNTLVKLTLGTGICVGSTPNTDVCLPVLKSLFLYTVWFVDMDFSDFVIRQCPVLEELYIHHSYINHEWWKGPYFTCHPYLKRFTLHYHNYPPSEIRRLEFNTPNLVYFDYSDRIHNVDYYWANFVDSLVEARLDLVLPYKCLPYEFENNLKIISWICNVQILYLSSTTVEMMCHCFDYWRGDCGFPLFNNLVYLSFECKTEQGWTVLSSLIENSPKLETLILKGFHCVRDCGVSVDGNVVKVLELYGFRGNRRELEQVRRFLCESEFLQLIKVQVDATIDDDQEFQLKKQLLALSKRSSKCQIHFL